MRTIGALSLLHGRVYVYLCNNTIRERFLADAETEGFIFRDGTLPTKRPDSDIYALNRDHTMCFPGFVGHMAFHSKSETLGDQKLLRVDYEKYILGFEKYLIENNNN